MREMSVMPCVKFRRRGRALKAVRKLQWKISAKAIRLVPRFSRCLSKVGSVLESFGWQAKNRLQDSAGFESWHCLLTSWYLSSSVLSVVFTAKPETKFGLDSLESEARRYVVFLS